MARPAPTFYIFHGTDEFSIAETIADFKRRLGPPDLVDLNTAVFDGADLTLSDLRNACDAIPFLTERRLIIVTNLLDRLSARPDRDLPRSLADFLAALLEYLPHLPETARLVFVEDKPIPASHPVSQLAQRDEHGFLKRFDPPTKGNLTRWVQDRASRYGGKIERQAADHLAVVISGNLRLLDQEITKLVTYTNAERTITLEDVGAMVSYAQEAVVFDLVDALGQQDGRTAALVLHRLLDTGEHALAILGMIVRQFRLLLQVKDLEDAGSTLQETTQALNLHPLVARKLHVQAIRFTGPQLRAIYRHLLDTDVAIKTGRLAPELALDVLVGELAVTAQ